MEITTRPRSRRWRRLAGQLSLLAVVLASCLLLPASLGLSQHVVSDDAMGGGLARGALTFDRPVSSVGRPRPGDVITFARPGTPDRLVTRRVVSVDGSAILTRGDARAGLDPWVLDVDVALPTTTVFSVPYVGYPELLVPGLTWTVLALLVALAALGAVVVARREASRERAIARPLNEPAALAAT